MNDQKNKFALFCIEVAQAGVALTKQELEIVFNAGLKLEGFTEDDLSKINEDHLKQAQQSVVAINKRKQMIEALTFNLLTKETVDELAAKDGLVEHVMKARHVAAVIVDELMEPDERLEKVVKDGRRVIETFIDQWKEMNTPKKEYEQEEDATIIE